jgi:hypothetical protein
MIQQAFKQAANTPHSQETGGGGHFSLKEIGWIPDRSHLLRNNPIAPEDQEPIGKNRNAQLFLWQQHDQERPQAKEQATGEPEPDPAAVGQGQKAGNRGDGQIPPAHRM